MDVTEIESFREEVNESQEAQAYAIGIEYIWPRVRSIWTVKRRRHEEIARGGPLAVSSEDVQAWWPEIRTLQTIQSVLAC